MKRTRKNRLARLLAAFIFSIISNCSGKNKEEVLANTHKLTKTIPLTLRFHRLIVVSLSLLLLAPAHGSKHWVHDFDERLRRIALLFFKRPRWTLRFLLRGKEDRKLGFQGIALLRLASCRKVEGERARKAPGLYCRALQRTWWFTFENNLPPI